MCNQGVRVLKKPIPAKKFAREKGVAPKKGGSPKDEPPVKGGQNEALCSTYSEMARILLSHRS